MSKENKRPDLDAQKAAAYKTLLSNPDLLRPVDLMTTTAETDTMSVRRRCELYAAKKMFGLTAAAAEGCVWNELPDETQDHHLSNARAAFDAILSELQEPSEGMRVAGNAQYDYDRQHFEHTSDRATIIFRKMIQHIRDGGA